MSNDEMFAEAANNWDLERLYRDLAEAKQKCAPRARKGLTEREKLYLRGLLCGCSPAEIARKLLQSPKGVEVYVCKTLYQYFKRMPDVPNEKVGNWRNINNFLEGAGYKSQTKSSVKSKLNYSLPLEPLVKIVNLGVEQHTISIDINIRLAFPFDAESQRTEDMGESDRTSS
ncbi:helix-turn-helix transcriptional regulator [Aerosakkonema sp. BLCC-F183]|uniref:helix-turn-helix transcriptional regulator n=1 Tax=Aerosakkonema sp. BLCC-F183 TaxID=3342834 RepID=UPI0035B98200